MKPNHNPPVEQFPVSTRALLARINRKLALDGEKMRAISPGSRWYHDHGPYYTAKGGAMTAWGISDLAKFAVECGAMKPYERWEDGR